MKRTTPAACAIYRYNLLQSIIYGPRPLLYIYILYLFLIIVQDRYIVFYRCGLFQIKTVIVILRRIYACIVYVIFIRVRNKNIFYGIADELVILYYYKINGIRILSVTPNGVLMWLNKWYTANNVRKPNLKLHILTNRSRVVLYFYSVLLERSKKLNIF